jgi:hypothetical protein
MHDDYTATNGFHQELSANYGILSRRAKLV